MKINSLTNSPNFCAIKVAKTKILECEPLSFDVYELYRGDRYFLQNFISNYDMQKMYPSLPSFENERWWHILKYCVTRAFSDENSSFLATYNNKPCGIMTFNQDEHNVINLEGMSSIPTEVDKKTPFVGKALFYQLFKYANEKDVKGISLNAVLDGPFDIINKYLNLGFKEGKVLTNRGHEYLNMFCNKHKIAEQLKELPFHIGYQEITENKHVNLNKILY